jgi:hypothetical protein
MGKDRRRLTFLSYSSRQKCGNRKPCNPKDEGCEECGMTKPEAIPAAELPISDEPSAMKIASQVLNQRGVNL